MLRIPYYRQRTDYLCGPASLQMALAAIGIRRSQRVLARSARTTAVAGTANGAMARVAARAGAYAAARNRATLWDLWRALRQRWSVIVNYIEPSADEGHYAVVAALSPFHITLRDPWNGRAFRLSTLAFLRRWVDGTHRHPRWMLTLSRHDFTGVPHLHPAHYFSPSS